MARPQSLYERGTRSVLPPPERRERTHVVSELEELIVIANVEYGLSEYDPELWRMIAEANGVVDPFQFSDFIGQTIRIPPRPLPSFT